MHRKIKRNQLVFFFLIALIIRGIFFFNIIENRKVIFQPDSRMYTSLAEGIKQHGSLCYPDSPGKPDVERMPGYPIFLFLILGLFGNNFLAVIIIQIIIDSLSCALVYCLGERLWEGAGNLSALIACLNMGMITYSHFILSDSLFLFIFLLIILCLMTFLREPNWQTAVALGVGIGLAAYIRPVIIYFPFFLFPFIFLYIFIKEDAPFLSAVGKAALPVVVFIMIMSPWMIRNYKHYGNFKLTCQAGEHLLQYIVPFSWQYSRGIPFIEGMKKANGAFEKKILEAGVDLQKISPFEKSELMVAMALDYLKEEPKAAIIKSWMMGMAKNLFSPAIIDLSYLLNIERPHFFYSKGKTLFERGFNFIHSMPGFFGWTVVVSIAFLLLARLIQLYGLFINVRHNKWEGMVLLLLVTYFLFVSGPVGYAKYRLPFEPILIILMTIGIKSFPLLYKRRSL